MVFIHVIRYSGLLQFPAGEAVKIYAKIYAIGKVILLKVLHYSNYRAQFSQ